MNHKFKIGDKVISATDTEKDKLFIITELLEQDGVYHIIPYDREKERTIVEADIKKIGRWRLKGQSEHVLLEEPQFHGLLDTIESEPALCICGQKHSRLRSEIEFPITAYQVKDCPLHISYFKPLLGGQEACSKKERIFTCVTCKTNHKIRETEIEEEEKWVTLEEYQDAYCFYGRNWGYSAQ